MRSTSVCIQFEFWSCCPYGSRVILYLFHSVSHDAYQGHVWFGLIRRREWDLGGRNLKIFCLFHESGNFGGTGNGV